MKFVMECGPCDGDRQYALDLVDFFADTHPDVAMKVQFYTADTLASHSAERYDHTDDRKISQRDLFSEQLDYDEWADVAQYAQKRGVEFFPSVFSIEAIDKAREMGINTFKIASGDITYLDLIRHAAWSEVGASVHDRVIISTGAATLPEVQRALDTAPSATFLACHLAYPTRYEDANLLRVSELRERLPYHQVGYSDHTRGYDTVAPLVTLGAAMWEKHFSLRTTNNDLADHAFAIRPNQLSQALYIAKLTEEMMGTGYLQPTPAELAARVGARRSLAASKPIKRGDFLTEENTTYLRPGSGIDFETGQRLLGKAQARVPIGVGMIITGYMVR